MVDRESEILSVPEPYAPAVAEAVAGLEGEQGVIRVPVEPNDPELFRNAAFLKMEAGVGVFALPILRSDGQFSGPRMYRVAPLRPGTVVEVECPECEGRGWVPCAGPEPVEEAAEKCPGCPGTGRLRFRVLEGLEVEPWCDGCEGRGRIGPAASGDPIFLSAECSDCDGAPPLCWGYEVEVVV